jgi:hypothetical protein
MNSPDSRVRVYRILAGCAILHALLLSLWYIFSWPVFPWSSEWESGPHAAQLWVAFATLWLFWPIVLSLHRGRSLRGVLFTLFISSVILYPSFREYDSDAPRMFGLPEGVETFSPFVIWDYFSGYRAGRTDAVNDLRLGRIVHEEIGMPRPPEYYSILRRYEIEPRSYGDVVTTKTIAHVKGYNELAEPAIKQKFGSDVISAAADEAWKHWKEAQAQKNR